MRGRRIESDSEVGEGRTDRELMFDCFQQGLSEVANTEHLERSTIEG